MFRCRAEPGKLSGKACLTFVQMRTELEDIEERVRQDLLSAANELRGQLGAAVRDLESFRTGTQQAVHERLQESVDAFSRATREQLDPLCPGPSRIVV